jgi:alanyl-tRNA synthetase
MKTLTAAQIRESFLRFFEERGHRRVASSSLVPQNDPTLLFANAGMNQFKDVFTGKETRDYRRATTSQKCVRAGGKHNDLENVGFTARHHTFFEMLGNFSFGDYFKKDAIAWAWEWVTSERWLGIPSDRLAATVFAGEGTIPWDEEAYELWKAQGVPPERIHKLGKKDNFWEMGETGPCGPCSELHFFQSADIPCAEEQAGRKCLGVACDCDRWLEIWNLVFMQFEKPGDGSMKPLPKPSIDTGAGLERVTAVVQGKLSNYETDLFQRIIAAVERISGKRYGADPMDDVSMRVIADHARATTFLVGDGVMPDKATRGYTLRRIMRRAIRHGKRLGLEKLFLADVCDAVIAEMGDAYPEIRDNRAFITKVARAEEEAFRRTLTRGLSLLDEEVARMEKAGEKVVPGKFAFLLSDTYGFPLDLTQTIAAERGLGVDEEGFKVALAGQQEGAGEFRGSGEKAIGDLHKQLAGELGEGKFLGYEATAARSQVRALIVNGARADRARKGDQVEVFTAATPFYGESGGQLGDTGAISTPGARVRVHDAKRPVPGLVAHQGEVVEGELAVGDEVALQVDEDRRDRIRANHSATHLLQFALRERLGDHVKQAGSVVAPDYLTFDFSHFEALSEEDLHAVEARVNDLVRRNEAADVAVLAIEEARRSGAMMIFGEKYGETVRVVRMGPSKEFCGGTHVRRTGDIAFFRIGSEESIAAGVRRIKAFTGPKAVEEAQRADAELRRAAALLKAGALEVAQKIEQTQRRVKELERALEEARGKVAAAQSGDLAARAREVGGAKVLSARVQGDGKALRELADKLRDRIGKGVVALGSEHEGKAVLLVAVTKDLTGKLKAGELVKEAARLVGGSGGGKPDLAQAGGPDPSGLDRALARVEELAAAALG